MSDSVSTETAPAVKPPAIPQKQEGAAPKTPLPENRDKLLNLTPEQKARLNALQLGWEVFGQGVVEESIRRGDSHSLNICLENIPTLLGLVAGGATGRTPEQLKSYIESYIEVIGVAFFGPNFLKIMEKFKQRQEPPSRNNV